MVLKDKVIIVTGASEGIGEAIAVRLSQESAKLAIVARDEAKLKKVASEIASSGGTAETFVCDIRYKEEIKNTIDSVAAKFGTIDVLINNAGIWQKTMQVDEIEDAVVEDVINTNLVGTIFATKYVLFYLRKKDSETAIINIVSKSGVSAQDGQSIYTASKWGVKGFTDVLRNDLKDTKIRLGAVYQAGINTEMFRKTGENFPQEDLTQPEDLADAVAYMLTRPAKMWMPEIRVSY